MTVKELYDKACAEGYADAEIRSTYECEDFGYSYYNRNPNEIIFIPKEIDGKEICLIYVRDNL